MTEAQARATVVNTAIAWLGCKEADGSHRKIIDTYNSHTPSPEGYQVKYTDAWCSTFVSAVAIKCGFTDIIPTECGCGKLYRVVQETRALAGKRRLCSQPGVTSFSMTGRTAATLPPRTTKEQPIMSATSYRSPAIP